MLSKEWESVVDAGGDPLAIDLSAVVHTVLAAEGVSVAGGEGLSSKRSASAGTGDAGSEWNGAEREGADDGGALRVRPSDLAQLKRTCSDPIMIAEKIASAIRGK